MGRTGQEDRQNNRIRRDGVIGVPTYGGRFARRCKLNPITLHRALARRAYTPYHGLQRSRPFAISRAGPSHQAFNWIGRHEREGRTICQPYLSNLQSTPSLSQNFADYDRAHVRQWSTADEKLTSARRGACVRVCVSEVLIRTRSAKKKKGVPVTQRRRLSFGVEQELNIREDNVADTRQPTK
jgi:hypothetical protein